MAGNVSARRAFVGYLVLTFALTYPLIAHFTTHIPGGNVDEGAFLWNIWWMKQALLDLHTNPLFTNYIFYPLGVNLALYTLTPLNGVLALPLTLTVGPIVASNVFIILGFTLSGFATYLLALEVGAKLSSSNSRSLEDSGSLKRDPDVRSLEDFGSLNVPSSLQIAAFIAGLVYAFASGRFIYAALGQYDYVSAQWIPLAILFFLRAVRRPGWRSPVLAGLFAACAGLTEMNFVVFLFIFALIFFAYAWARQRATVFNRLVAGRLAAALVVFVIGFGPLGLAVIGETIQQGDYLVRGWGGADTYLVDLLGPLVPSPLSTLLGGWARQAAHSFSDINFAFAGYLALVLAALGTVGNRVWGFGFRVPGSGLRAQHSALSTQHSTGNPLPHTLYPIPYTLYPALWPLTAAVFFVLSLGPLLHINGKANFNLDGLMANIPLPYIIIHYLPILKGARVPGRFAIMATLALAMLVAFGCLLILKKLHGRGRQATAIVLSLGIIAGNLSTPLPLTNAVVPEPYKMIAAQSGEFTILQIPLGWRDGFDTVGRERTLLQSYQSVHGKHILGGNTSRSPDGVLSYYAQLPVLRSIVALEEGRSLEPGVEQSDRAQAADVLAFFDIRDVVVQGEFVGGPVDTYIQSVLPVDRISAGIGHVQNSFWHIGADGKWVDQRTEDSGWVLYAVRAVPPRVVTSIDLGTPGAQMYLPAGWSRAETTGDTSFSWAVSPRASLLLRLAPQPPMLGASGVSPSIGGGGASSALALRAAPFSYPGAPAQKMTVAVNGHTIGAVVLAEGWQEYRLPVPSTDVAGGINQVTLMFNHLASPAQVLDSSDTRMLAAAVDWVKLE
jgi:hypothetical protein